MLISFPFFVHFLVSNIKPWLGKTSVSSAIMPAFSIPQLLLLFEAFSCAPLTEVAFSKSEPLLYLYF